jgi:hypothetical protein
MEAVSKDERLDVRHDANASQPADILIPINEFTKRLQHIASLAHVCV